MVLVILEKVAEVWDLNEVFSGKKKCLSCMELGQNFGWSKVETRILIFGLGRIHQ